ncbi:MAG: ETC complex I subunit [Pseudomonadota bacterium]|nr:ETC complex I subunit [Pseudomonadota bacterium]
MAARIYSPARNVMQSGKGKSGRWVLEYTPEVPKTVNPLMGWISSTDMKQQLRLEFPSREAAVAYAERNAIAYEVQQPTPVRLQKKSYSDNFRFGRKDIWTH